MLPAVQAILSRFVPPVVLMAVIFWLSAQPSLSSGLEWDFVLRKGAHMTEYALLAVLWWRALGWRRPAVAVAIALAYAASDELHQSFVFGRHGSPVDWLIDAAGVAIGMLVAGRLLRASRARWR